MLTLNCSVRWRHRSPVTIERVIAHPSEEQIAIIERVSPATNINAPSTRILIFRPTSSSPTFVRTLPFQLRSVASVPPSGFFPTDPSGFTLVGITEAWSVVVFGDDVQLPEEEGASAQGITQDATIGKRTLFHDIFGVSAFTDLATAPGPSSVQVASAAQPRRGKEVTVILDTPAHLLPPLETLFDTVMDGFLATRPVEDEQEPEHEHLEEMEVDEPEDDSERRPKASAPLDRVVDRQEMHGFVDLFIQHAIKGKMFVPGSCFFGVDFLPQLRPRIRRHK